MDFRKEIKDRGLKITWVADKIECNYQSLKVYLWKPSIMPTWVEQELKELFK